MKTKINKIISIKNLGIKLFLGFWGVVLMVGSTWPLVSYWFYINDDPGSWDSDNTIGLVVGFVLAVGGYKYNVILDKILNRI